MTALFWPTKLYILSCADCSVFEIKEYFCLSISQSVFFFLANGTCIYTYALGPYIIIQFYKYWFKIYACTYISYPWIEKLRKRNINHLNHCNHLIYPRVMMNIALSISWNQSMKENTHQMSLDVSAASFWKAGRPLIEGPCCNVYSGRNLI